MIVAIDGPAGAGKSSASKLLARRLGFSLVDTGAIYRCVALKALREGMGLEDDARLEGLLPRLGIAFRMEGEENRVLLDGEDVTLAIRAPEISLGASKVSARPVVRAGLLELQRHLALGAERGAILEGRDIGTVVFPDADAKFFLEANAEVRAQRRHQELLQRGVEARFQEVLADQLRRDRDDASRAVAPLQAAQDAVRVDSTFLTLEEVVRLLEEETRARTPAARGR